MFLWLQIAHANDYNLISEQEVHAQHYQIYREINYQMPQINSERNTVDIEISSQMYCIQERHFEQTWRSGNVTNIFQAKTRDYILYNIISCPQGSISEANEPKTISSDHQIPNYFERNSILQKIDISSIHLNVQSFNNTLLIKDHSKVLSINFSTIGELYLQDLTTQEQYVPENITSFTINIFSSNYTYNPITDSSHELRKRIEHHNNLASSLDSPVILSLQNFTVGHDSIQIQPSLLEINTMKCSALQNYISENSNHIPIILKNSTNWPCTEDLNKIKSKMCSSFSQNPNGTHNNEDLQLIHEFCPQYGNIKLLIEEQIQKDLHFGLFTQAQSRLIAFEDDLDTKWLNNQRDIIREKQFEFIAQKKNDHAQKIASCLERLSKPTLCDAENLSWICNGCGQDPDCPCCEYTILERNEICRQEINK